MFRMTDEKGSDDKIICSRPANASSISDFIPAARATRRIPDPKTSAQAQVEALLERAASHGCSSGSL